MMNTPTFNPPVTPPANVLSEHMVGVHFALPLTPRLVAVAAVTSPVCVLYFARSLEVLLRREGILCGDMGAHGDLCEGLIMFSTSDLSRALATVEELLEAWAFRTEQVTEWVEVAWFHAADLVWRPHPADASRPFERWLTPDLYDLRTLLGKSAMIEPPAAPPQ